MGRSFHNVLTFFLTAAVLTGSTVSPVVTHVHVNGDETHSHDSEVNEYCGKHEHGDTQAQGHSHRQDEKTLHECVSNGLEYHVPHLHLLFIGIDFSFPLQDRNGSDRPLTWQDYGHPGIVRLVDDVIPVSRLDIVEAIDRAATLLVCLDQSDAKTTHATQSGVLAVGRVLLCGIVRSELSSVLLI